MCFKCGDNRCKNTSTCSGSVGIPGTPGNDGLDGNSILTGSGAPNSGLGVDNDLYVDVDNGDLYEKAGGNWSVIGNIKGQDGINGEDGNSVLFGVVAPLDTNGNDGDIYIDTATGDLYTKAGGTWSLAINLIGPQGAPGVNGVNGLNIPGDDGLSFRQGAGVPGAGLGVDGDSYLDNVSLDIYVKSAGVWVLTGNIGVATGGDGSFTAESELDIILKAVTGESTETFPFTNIISGTSFNGVFYSPTTSSTNFFSVVLSIDVTTIGLFSSTIGVNLYETDGVTQTLVGSDSLAGTLDQLGLQTISLSIPNISVLDDKSYFLEVTISVGGGTELTVLSGSVFSNTVA